MSNNDPWSKYAATRSTAPSRPSSSESRWAKYGSAASPSAAPVATAEPDPVEPPRPQPSFTDRIASFGRRATALGQTGSDTIQQPEPVQPEPVRLPPVVVDQRGESTPLVSSGAGGTFDDRLPIIEAAARSLKRGGAQIAESLTGAGSALITSPLNPVATNLRAMGGELTPLESEESLPGNLIRRMQAVQEEAAPSLSVQEGGAFDPGNPRWWLERGLEQAPQLLLALGAGAATGGLAGFALPTALQEGGRAFLDTREALLASGDDPAAAEAKAQGAALLTGVGSAALETIPGSAILLKRLPGASKVFSDALMQRLAGRVAVGAGAEGLTEAAQEAWSDAVQFAATEDPEAFNDWANRYAGAGALGAGVGGLASAATGSQPLTRAQQARQVLEARQAPARPEAVEVAAEAPIVPPEVVAPPVVEVEPEAVEQAPEEAGQQANAEKTGLAGGGEAEARIAVEEEGAATMRPFPRDMDEYRAQRDEGRDPISERFYFHSTDAETIESRDNPIWFSTAGPVRPGNAFLVDKTRLDLSKADRPGTGRHVRYSGPIPPEAVVRLGRIDPRSEFRVTPQVIIDAARQLEERPGATPAPGQSEQSNPTDLFGTEREPATEQESAFTERDFAPEQKARAEETQSRPLSPEEIAAQNRDLEAEGVRRTARDEETADLDLEPSLVKNRRQRDTATFHKTRGAAKALADDRLLSRYRRALRTQTIEYARASAFEGKGGRIKRDYADGETPIGTAGTGKGAFERGRLTQADARVEAYEEEIRGRPGLTVPTVEEAFIDAKVRDLPEEVQEEFSGLRELPDDQLFEQWGRAEEEANVDRDDPLVQVRRAIYAGEVQRRGFDLDEEPVGEEDDGLPFDPKPEQTTRIARNRILSERDIENDPVARQVQRSIRQPRRSSAVGFPKDNADIEPTGASENTDIEESETSAEAPEPARRRPAPADPLAPEPSPEQTEEFARRMKGRLKTAKEKAKRTNAPKVIQALARVAEAAGADVPIRTGRLGTRSALGIFKVQEEVIRVLEANSIPTAAHEVGHAIEKAVYGWDRGGPWKNPRVGRAIQAELLKLGRDLYGDRTPAGGYKREGWAEFARMWVTEQETARERAPRLTAWFEDTFSKEFPKVREALDEAQKEATVWQEQGSRARVEESVVDTASPTARLNRAAAGVRGFFTMAQHVEMMQPLFDLARAAEEKLGRKLQPSEDPFATGSALRMSHATRTKYMVENAMIDLAGNPTGEPGLQEIRGLVQGRQKEFTVYLYARRAVKLYTDPNGARNPGIALRDARQVIKELESPEFQLAADKVYAWNEGVLDYAADASEDFAQVVKAIRERDPGDYIPLQREFDDLDEAFQKMGGGAGGNIARGNLVKRLEGSGRRIKDPFPAMIAKAEGMVRQAHGRLIIEQVMRLSEVEGLGHLIEEVPVNQVPVASAKVSEVMERIERELFGTIGKAGSVDINNPFGLPIDPDAVLTFFAPAPTPNGPDAVFPVWKDGKPRWYQMDPELYNTLSSLDVYRLADAAGKLGVFVKWLAEVPAEVFRAGTTTLRASFGLVTNPLRDVQTMYVNSRAQASGKQMFGAWLLSVVDAGLYRIAPTEELQQKAMDRAPYMDAFIRLGGEMAQSLGQDIPHTRRAAHRLFQGRVARTADPRNWFDWYRELIQTPESAPRVAELRMVAKDIGWEPGQKMSLDQSLQLLNASKQVTVDFSAAGEFARALNRASPFYNVSFQGPRATVRAVMRNPSKAALRGLVGVTIPSLLLWWQAKDEEWWKELPYVDRLLYWHIAFDNPFTGAGELLRIPRAHELTPFAGMPVMFADAWYSENPEEAKAFFEEAFGFLSPIDSPYPWEWPVLGAEAAQQRANRDFFWDTPIVPRGEQEKPAEEQFNEYTSRVAIELGKMFKVSPRRIDHAIRGLGGGAATDIVDLVGLGPKQVERESELSDTPIVGRLFQRGGQLGTRPKSVEDIYEKLELAQRRAASEANPETPKERQERLQLEDAARALSALSYVRSQEVSAEQRRDITRQMLAISREATSFEREGRLARERIRGRRQNAELLKERVSRRSANAQERK